MTKTIGRKDKAKKLFIDLFDWLFDVNFDFVTWMGFVFCLMSFMFIEMGVGHLALFTSWFEVYVTAFILMIYVGYAWSYVMYIAKGFVNIAWGVSALYVVTPNIAFINFGAVIFVEGCIISLIYRIIKIGGLKWLNKKLRKNLRH